MQTHISSSRHGKKLLLLLASFSIATLIGAGSQHFAANDAWYSITAQGKPWGYFHEVIEHTDKGYAYRYEMVKRENGTVLKENVGAIAKDDLTPIAFNVTKTGNENTGDESYDGAYLVGASAGTMNIKAKFGKTGTTKTLKRYLSAGTILEVFFPVYVSVNWKTLKPNKELNLPILVEDPELHDYKTKTAAVKVLGDRPAKNGEACKQLRIELDGRESVWCLTSTGALVDFNILNSSGKPEVVVRKIASEREAKVFLGL